MSTLIRSKTANWFQVPRAQKSPSETPRRDPRSTHEQLPSNIKEHKQIKQKRGTKQRSQHNPSKPVWDKPLLISSRPQRSPMAFEAPKISPSHKLPDPRTRAKAALSIHRCAGSQQKPRHFSAAIRRCVVEGSFVSESGCPAARSRSELGGNLSQR